MNGVGGFSPWRNTIYLFLFKTKPVSKWYSTIKEVFCHEYAHAYALNFSERKTLLDDLIFEGLAEHFMEAVLKTKSKLGHVLKKQDVLRFLKALIPKFNSRNRSLKSAVFSQDKKYPLWAGYSIGYHLVQLYLGQYKRRLIPWKEILKSSPREIYKQIEQKLKFEVSSIK